MARLSEKAPGATAITFGQKTNDRSLPRECRHIPLIDKIKKIVSAVNLDDQEEVDKAVKKLADLGKKEDGTHDKNVGIVVTNLGIWDARNTVKVLQLFCDNKTIPQIEKAMDVTRNTVTNKIRSLGLARGYVGKQNEPPKENARVGRPRKEDDLYQPGIKDPMSGVSRDDAQIAKEIAAALKLGD